MSKRQLKKLLRRSCDVLRDGRLPVYERVRQAAVDLEAYVHSELRQIPPESKALAWRDRAWRDFRATLSSLTADRERRARAHARADIASLLDEEPDRGPAAGLPLCTDQLAISLNAEDDRP
jgi:hypothetical protein